MRRWVPFAIAIFMLLPFALWGGMALFGPGGGLELRQSGAGTVLLAASLPLAGLFWIQNLRQLGDSMGEPSRLGLAARLASVLPAAILAIGGAGTAWLLSLGGDFLEPTLALAGTLVMAGVAWVVARAPVEPGRIVAAPPAPAAPGRENAAAHSVLMTIGNVAVALGLLAYYWTPFVLLWAAFAMVPVAFVAMIALTWWAAQTDVVEHAEEDATALPANDSLPRMDRAA